MNPIIAGMFLDGTSLICLTILAALKIVRPDIALPIIAAIISSRAAPALRSQFSPPSSGDTSGTNTSTSSKGTGGMQRASLSEVVHHSGVAALLILVPVVAFMMSKRKEI